MYSTAAYVHMFYLCSYATDIDPKNDEMLHSRILEAQDTPYIDRSPDIPAFAALLLLVKVASRVAVRASISILNLTFLIETKIKC